MTPERTTSGAPTRTAQKDMKTQASIRIVIGGVLWVLGTGGIVVLLQQGNQSAFDQAGLLFAFFLVGLLGFLILAHTFLRRRRARRLERTSSQI